MLEVKGLRAGYGSAQVLHGVDLRVGSGEVVGLLGRNGMGKTTLVHAITGIIASQAEALRFAGDSIAAQPAHRIARRGVALVPEGRQVYANLSVLEHLSAFTRPGADGRTPWHAARVFQLFPRLSERRSQWGAQLSGGEQQMLAIGRALVTNPRLLILDEATEGLAPLVREEIWHALSQLRDAGQSILVIDKYVQRLIRLADHHVVLEKGRVAWAGSSDALSADPTLWRRYLGV
ncbi:MAG: ABC transporter ATP-binding protein [Burkholderiaceae bacterium]|nr:ABC transporter ATP-binding protein [Burkholderiaceae bacterium]